MGVLDDGERVHAPDGATWQRWLEAHHERSSGVWLLRGRPGFTHLHVDYEDAIRQALCFGWIDGPVRTFDSETGGLWFTPRGPSGGCAATNKARLIELEAAGLITAAGYRAIEVAKANGSWTILDRADAGIEPPDLTAALDAMPAARAGWDAFPLSTRKFGIARVDSAKRPETRAARVAKIVTNAAEGRRPQ